MTTPDVVRRWHAIARSGDAAALADILAEDAVFRSPARHPAQEGKALTTAYLGAALVVLGPTLTYHREWYAHDSAVLEFTARLDDREVHGIDMIGWNEAGEIDSFTVMVRPLSALNVLIEKMSAQLTGQLGG